MATKIKNRNESTEFQTINEFWKWFAANNKMLMVLYKSERFEQLGQHLNYQLDKIKPQLAWEIGPGKSEHNLLTISAEGNPRLRKIADLMIRLAPRLKGWEFHSSKPARSPAAIVRLPESGESFETSKWEFVPLERAECGRLDLIVVDNLLAQSERETALTAVSIYLDELLGEDIVEKWIGGFEVKSPIRFHEKTTYRITELPDYLEWAITRKNNPLTKHDIQ
jgi:hypothetical protein